MRQRVTVFHTFCYLCSQWPKNEGLRGKTVLGKYCSGSKWIEPEDKNAIIRWQCLLMHVFMAKETIWCSQDQIQCFIEKTRASQASWGTTITLKTLENSFPIWPILPFWCVFFQPLEDTSIYSASLAMGRIAWWPVYFLLTWSLWTPLRRIITFQRAGTEVILGYYERFSGNS